MAEELTLHRQISNDYSHYHPLSSGSHEIRLLRILPDDDADCLDGELAVVLQKAKLPTDLEYRALSYCWGPLDDVQTIAVIFEDEVTPEGQTTHHDAINTGARAVRFKITSNLYDALISFRRSNDRGHFWIDMLCINQGDVDERSAQVGFMRTIYESASSVIVWLGNDPEVRDAVFAPENLDLALFNLGMEKMGWGSAWPLHRFVTDNMEQLASLAWKRDYMDDESIVNGVCDEMSERALMDPTYDFQLTVLLEESSQAFGQPVRADWDKSSEISTIETLGVEQVDRPEWMATIIISAFSAYITKTWREQHPALGGHSSRGQILSDYCSRISTQHSEVWQWMAYTQREMMCDGPPRPYPFLENVSRRMSVLATIPWFRRVWVIQEIASAKRVRIRAAEQEGSWDMLRSFLTLAHDLDTIARSNDTDITWQNSIPSIWTELRYLAKSNTLTVARLLTSLSLFSATDKRDMAIALFGLGSDLQGGTFQPDYRCSVNETFARFTLSVIGSTRSLDILSKTNIGLVEGRPSGLPSWVPYYGETRSGIANIEGVSAFASSSRRVRQRPPSSWRSLYVGGRQLTTVRKVVGSWLLDDFSRDMGFEVPAPGLFPVFPIIWKGLNDVYDSIFRGGRSQCLEFARLPQLTPTSFYETLCPQEVDGFNYFLDMWHNQDERFTVSGIWPLLAPSQRARLEERLVLSEEDRDSPNYIKYVATKELSQRVFSFSEDGELGLCPEETRPGDIVAALYGLRDLVVLRPTRGSHGTSRSEEVQWGQGYQLVGICRIGRLTSDNSLDDSADDGPAATAEGGSDPMRLPSPRFFCIE